MARYHRVNEMLRRMSQSRCCFPRNSRKSTVRPRYLYHDISFIDPEFQAAAGRWNGYRFATSGKRYDASFKRIRKAYFFAAFTRIWNFEIYREIGNIVANIGSQMRSVLIIAYSIELHGVAMCSNLFIDL